MLLSSCKFISKISTSDVLSDNWNVMRQKIKLNLLYQIVCFMWIKFPSWELSLLYENKVCFIRIKFALSELSLLYYISVCFIRIKCVLSELSLLHEN